MKKLILLLCSLPYFVTAQVPPKEDISYLKHPFVVSEFYIGHKNCELMFIFEGIKGYGDILYYSKRGSTKLIKIPLPENLEKKKHLVFLFQTETGVAFAEKQSSRRWSTFYLETMTWLSEKKIRGHDGEDKID